MTKEAMIKVLRYKAEHIKAKIRPEFFAEVADTLERQPCEDCVSRKRLMDNYNGVETPVGYRKVVDLEVIKNMPPVTPIRPKGHWTKEFNDLEGETKFTCSSCGKYQLFETDFCYNCGSDNRVRDKE